MTMKFLYARHIKLHDLISFSQQLGGVGAHFPDEILKLLVFERDYVDQLPKEKPWIWMKVFFFPLCDAGSCYAVQVIFLPQLQSARSVHPQHHTWLLEQLGFKPSWPTASLQLTQWCFEEPEGKRLWNSRGCWEKKGVYHFPTGKEKSNGALALTCSAWGGVNPVTDTFLAPKNSWGNWMPSSFSIRHFYLASESDLRCDDVAGSCIFKICFCICLCATW